MGRSGITSTDGRRCNIYWKMVWRDGRGEAAGEERRLTRGEERGWDSRGKESEQAASARTAVV